MPNSFQRISMIVLIFAISMAVAGAAAPGYFWPPAKDVAVFKDGCAYIVREGEAEIGADGVVTERIPRAVLGTLDVYSLAGGVGVGEVVAFYEPVDKTRPVGNLAEFYSLLIGKRLTLVCGQDTLTGTLRAVLDPGQLLVGTEDGAILVPMAQVTRLALAGEVPGEISERIQQPRLRIRLNGSASRARLGLSYLEESWNWMPSYRLNLLDAGRAELVLSATVANNAEDVSGCTLHLIVGVANFVMRGQVSPLVLNVETGRVESYDYAAFSNALKTQQAAPLAQDLDAAVRMAPAKPAGSLEDLFVYEKRGFSLGRGERMQFELFRGTVPCEPVYKWDLPLPDANLVYNQSYLKQQGNMFHQDEQTAGIWHYLRLSNNTAVPWTTGPVMVVSGWQPVAQDQMKYVPVGGRYDLRVTMAPDVKGEAAEEEIGRKIVRMANNDDYLQIHIHGALTLRNYKQTPVRLEIAKELWGNITESGEAAAARSGGESLWNVNPRSRLEWKIDLPAGGERKLTYGYELLINI